MSKMGKLSIFSLSTVVLIEYAAICVMSAKAAKAKREHKVHHELAMYFTTLIARNEVPLDAYDAIALNTILEGFKPAAV